jgi:hypothetical protein
MEQLFHFALALLSAGAPWLAGVIVVAVALAFVGPVKLSLSIGDRSGQTNQTDSSPRIDSSAYADRRLRPEHTEIRATRKGLLKWQLFRK